MLTPAAAAGIATPGPVPIGECEKNEAFMIGTEQAPGQCVKACNKCPGVAAATEAPVEADVAVEAE